MQRKYCQIITEEWTAVEPCCPGEARAALGRVAWHGRGVEPGETWEIGEAM